MKLKRILLSLCFTIALIILRSSSVLAEGITIENDAINAEITKDGAINVTEDITYNISGKYNGLYKDISFDKAGGISGISVIGYTKVDSARNGDKGVYTLENANKNIRVKIYTPSNNETKTFRIQYRIDSAIKKYKDIGEFYWKFIDKENETDIRSLEIILMLPEGSKRDEIRAFGHGPLEGTWSILDDRRVRFSVTDLPAGKYVEIRALFPQALLPTTNITADENRLQQILSEEESYHETKEAAHKRFQAMRILLKYIAIVISVFNLFIIAFIFLRFQKQEELWFGNSPSIQDYNPTLLAYVAKRYLYNQDLLAALLELVRKGYLSIVPIEEWVSVNKYSKKNFKNYKIIKLLEADESLLRHERNLMNWLIDVIGDGSTVTLEKIKRYGESRPVEFRRQFTLWLKEIKLDADKRVLFDRKADMTKGIFVILEVLLIVISTAFIALVQMYGVLSLMTSLAAFTAAVFINVRTAEGNHLLFLWKEMKHKLQTCKQKDIDIWIQNPSQLELYTIYAVSMGLQDTISLKLKPYLTSENYNSLFNMIIFYSIIKDKKDSGFYGAFDSSFSDTGSSGSFSSGDGGGSASGGGGGAGGF